MLIEPDNHHPADRDEKEEEDDDDGEDGDIGDDYEGLIDNDY